MELLQPKSAKSAKSSTKAASAQNSKVHAHQRTNDGRSREKTSTDLNASHNSTTTKDSKRSKSGDQEKDSLTMANCVRATSMESSLPTTSTTLVNGQSKQETAGSLKMTPEAFLEHQKAQRREARRRRKFRLEGETSKKDQNSKAKNPKLAKKISADDVTTEDAQLVEVKKKKHKQKKTKVLTTKNVVEHAANAAIVRKASEKWKLSQAIGGRFSNVSPLFSNDEKFLLLIQSSTVKIFSTKTSLLARTLSVSNPPKSRYHSHAKVSVIVGYAFHPQEVDKLYTVTSTGEIWLWNWLEGTIEGWWATGLVSTVETGKGGIAVTEGDNDDIFLWICLKTPASAKTKAERSLRRIRLPLPAHYSPESNENKPEIISICQLDDPVQALQVLDSNTFVLINGRSIVIGNKYKNSGADDKWGSIREFTANAQLACLDVLVATQSVEGKKGKKGEKSAGLDIAVGDLDGVIYVYQDVLKIAGPTDQPVIRRLHWHRGAVATVRWGLDGTYLISGGKETVLVIWQMTTSHKQFLPHLSAAIQDIVVSPRGRDYAVRLGDNSFMILSTTELKPKTHISGIQTRVFASVRNEAMVQAETSWTVPCVVQPNVPTQVLFATPTTQTEGSSSPYLQVYDTATDRGLSRQAITRTLASSKNISPEGAPLREPNVKLMAISHDGKWLATVDEWAAPASDFVDLNAPKPPKSAIVAKEVFLRFWQWNSAVGSGQWELVTRIDAPHMVTSTGSSADISDLVAAPNGLSFTTVGNDGNVKIWKPRPRTRAGVKVEKEGMYVWGCRKIVEITRVFSEEFMDGKVAYSNDGSILAVSASEYDDAVVYIVDPVSGTVQHTIDSLQTSNICGLGFVNQYLVIAGFQRLVVWNLVAGYAQWACELSALVPSQTRLDCSGYVPNIHLAADGRTETFAVAINYPKVLSPRGRPAASNTASQVSVFKVSSPAAITTQKITHAVVALKCITSGNIGSRDSTNVNGGGYLWLDGTAVIKFLSPKSAITSYRGVPAVTEMTDAYLDVGGLSNAYLNIAKPTSTPLENRITDVDMDEDSSVKIIRSDTLAQLFPAPPYASNALEDVFDTFMGLLGEKPLDVDVDENDEVYVTNGLLMDGAEADEDEEMDGDDDEEEEANERPESPLMTRQRVGVVENSFDEGSEDERD